MSWYISESFTSSCPLDTQLSEKGVYVEKGCFEVFNRSQSKCNFQTKLYKMKTMNRYLVYILGYLLTLDSKKSIANEKKLFEKESTSVK